MTKTNIAHNYTNHDNKSQQYIGNFPLTLLSKMITKGTNNKFLLKTFYHYITQITVNYVPLT